MKILLLGGAGQVGQELRRSLAPLGAVTVSTRTGELPDGASCERLDLADLDAIAPLIERVAPDVVVNATAYTAVDRAEQEPELAHRINALAPGCMAVACAAAGATLLHYSTDYVFDGLGTRPYRENDPTSPLGVYGSSKLAGEEAIRAAGARYLILRTAWVYGLHGQNFLRTMLRLADRDALRVVADQTGCPTPAWLIADVSAQILARGIGAGGTHHIVAGGEVSWHGFAEAIFRESLQAGLIERAPAVAPITTAEYPTPARRPAYSVLDTTTLRDQYRIELPHWHAALRNTLQRVTPAI